MNVIRSEAKQAIIRWREALIGAGVGLVGVRWALTAFGTLQMIGMFLSVAGAILIFAGIQRARFRLGQGGPGVVHVDEGQVTYFGPFEGGSVSTASLARVELEPQVNGAFWVLTEPGQPPLSIPTDAEGADILFDVFAALPGIRTERMLVELGRRPTKTVLIWERAAG